MTKRKHGDYVGACPIYGYRKDPENKNYLVIDEHTARVVRDIYCRRIDGASVQRIANELNRRGILSPPTYKVDRGLPHPTGGYADVADAKWSAQAVIRILREETYTDVHLQGRQETHSHKLKQIKKNLLTRKINTVKGKKYIYYHCPTGKKNGCSCSVMLKDGDLVQCVLESLQAHISSVVSLEELLDSVSEEQANQELIAGYKEQIADNQVKAEQVRRFKAMLYENLMNGLITKDEYRYSKDLYTTQIEQAQKAVELLRTEMERAASNASDRLRWTRLAKLLYNP